MIHTHTRTHTTNLAHHTQTNSRPATTHPDGVQHLGAEAVELVEELELALRGAQVRVLGHGEAENLLAHLLLWNWVDGGVRVYVCV